MQQQHNLVRLKELTKGVESIVEVDWKNEEWAKKKLDIQIFDPPVTIHIDDVFSLSGP